MHPQAAAALRQAKNYLLASHTLSEMKLVNPAVSTAIHASVLAKDAFCLEFSGQSKRPKNHELAVEELRETGKVPKAQLEQFRDLIQAKNDAEYEAPNLTEKRSGILNTQADRFCSFVENATSLTGI